MERTQYQIQCLLEQNGRFEWITQTTLPHMTKREALEFATRGNRFATTVEYRVIRVVTEVVR